MPEKSGVLSNGIGFSSEFKDGVCDVDSINGLFPAGETGDGVVAVCEGAQFSNTDAINKTTKILKIFIKHLFVKFYFTSTTNKLERFNRR